MKRRRWIGSEFAECRVLECDDIGFNEDEEDRERGMREGKKGSNW